jgi:hypothetical protein
MDKWVNKNKKIKKVAKRYIKYLIKSYLYKRGLRDFVWCLFFLFFLFPLFWFLFSSMYMYMYVCMYMYIYIIKVCGGGEGIVQTEVLQHTRHQVHCHRWGPRYIYTYTYMYIHVHTCTYMYTHTQKSETWTNRHSTVSAQTTPSPYNR